MLIITGGSALSVSKTASTLQILNGIIPRVKGLDSAYIHFVKCTSDDAESVILDQDNTARKTLDTLLSYADSHSVWKGDKYNSTTIYVTPRPGSISPWSSKATEISKICNLGSYVERIERGVMYTLELDSGEAFTTEELALIANTLHDRMTQVLGTTAPLESQIFQVHDPKPLQTITLRDDTTHAYERLTKANKELGLALSQEEMEYLIDAYVSSPDNAGHDPTDAELFMFAQVNSEHCRHKIFNASWTVDGQAKEHSLFQMIRNTERVSPKHTLSAYSDNAAVFAGYSAPRLQLSTFAEVHPTMAHEYTLEEEEMSILVKVETHNHPTAVSPYPGAATGSGGEIRDEGSVGQGSKPKAGLAGFTVSNLLIPDFIQPWEKDFGRPAHIASALDIMIQAPLGSSAYNNEFGRPALAGYFRTFAQEVKSASGVDEVRGYHKPIMIAGGLGNVRPQFILKKGISPGAKIAVLGGPGLLIGLGGGAASSVTSGTSSAHLDFASVQRDNAEMQRRCQQVINACTDLGDKTPIQSIHDVGAGGLSNALPELVHDSSLGAVFEIRDVHVADSSMSPMEIWCNESQERYVLAISPEHASRFEAIAKRERCPFSFVGVATKEENLVVTDRLLKKDVIRLKMSALFGKPPRMKRKDETLSPPQSSLDTTLAKHIPNALSLADRLETAALRILRLPAVGSKSFLITIGDRSVTGLVARDQMIGPWQVPVADVAVTRTSYGFDVITGEAMAMGERPVLALLNAAASAKMAVAEALTNIVASSIESIDRVKLSANWMSAASRAGEGSKLFEAVEAVGMELCPALGIGIPVGKDSLSMSMKWQENGQNHEVSSPLSLNITAFAPVKDIRRTWTPQLRTDIGEKTTLLFFDIASGKQRLGGSSLAQAFCELGSESPDVDQPSVLKAFFNGSQKLREQNSDCVLAYHDRSDGGLFTTIVEMCFAGRTGVTVNIGPITQDDVIAALFNEELGAVMQVRTSDLGLITSTFSSTDFPLTSIHAIGEVNANKDDQSITVLHNAEPIFQSTRATLQKAWSETSYHMQKLRDEPNAALSEFNLISDDTWTGLRYEVKFPLLSTQNFVTRPKVAILREQGVNGQQEMAWAFMQAGFTAIDVHMSDIINGDIDLADFVGAAACGGFSFGDVLGAGNGWAQSALRNQTASQQFATFFKRSNTFVLGVCNGCQFLSQMKDLIPGAESWPSFKPNLSERYEARVCVVEIVQNDITAKSVFLREMAGSKLPVAVAHGEGHADFKSESEKESFHNQGLMACRYVDAQGQPTERYPLNPNGSADGLTGIQTPDGRFLALMPHPERVVALHANSWFPPEFEESWKGVGPWFRIFQNARAWCG